MPPEAATSLRRRPLTPTGVWLAELVSPDGLNRLTPALLREIALLPEVHGEARGFVLTGNARCFSAGANLNDIAGLAGAEAWRLGREGQRWLGRIAAAPIVAAVAGACMGGGFDLALACRARFCTPDAYFGHHGARLGLVTGWGGTQRLGRLLGAAAALEHLAAAEGWSAEAALASGLVRALCEPDELLARAAAAAAAGAS